MTNLSPIKRNMAKHYTRQKKTTDRAELTRRACMHLYTGKTIQETAVLLGVSYQTLRIVIKGQGLPFTKQGGARLSLVKHSSFIALTIERAAIKAGVSYEEMIRRALNLIYGEGVAHAETFLHSKARPIVPRRKRKVQT